MKKVVTTDIVSKLWNACNKLRADGVDYRRYLAELTYLLFLKMLEETGEESNILEKYRWHSLKGTKGAKRLELYREILLELSKTQKEEEEVKQKENQGALNTEKTLRIIYNNANTVITEPVTLTSLVETIDGLDWFKIEDKDALGDLYEGLLEKSVAELKSGPGQYFTPRALIDSMVELIKPQINELINDPSAGTGGFLISANQYIRKHTNNFETLNNQQQAFQYNEALTGMELVPETHRLCLMNLILHKIDGNHLINGNTLSSQGANLPFADIILANPPFGSKKSGNISRDDLPYFTSNKQLMFLQHIYRHLNIQGRCAVVVPDNVLFEKSTGKDIRKDLLRTCNLHTILRLPIGLFYAKGVNTNVLFFQYKSEPEGNDYNTKEIYFYDLRTNMPKFNKSNPFTRKELKEFEDLYNHRNKKSDRWKKYTLKQLEKKDFNLDITWLKNNSITDPDDLPEPEIILENIITSMQKINQSITNIKSILK